MTVKRKMAHGEDGVIVFTKLMEKDNLNSILDIGSGDKRHLNYMFDKFPNTFSNDFDPDNDYIGDFNTIVFERMFDGIHAAHVLEHQLNVNVFLKKIHSLLNEGGYLCITVPPLKHQIVGGHVSLWNAGLILYNLVLAGFDCSENVFIKEYGYNISVIVKKKSIENFPKLTYDGPDLMTLNEYFPKNLRYDQYGTFNGDIKKLT